MASFVSSVTSNASSSIYGNRNVISGLASGMDTESMIENAVSGIKLKVTNLQQNKTQVEWEQSILRDIIDKLADFSESYTSYASSTNLLSASFFNNAVNVSTNGQFANLISASGKTSSDISILGVQSLATAATYTAAGIGNQASAAAITGSQVDLNGDVEQSAITGSLTFQYGGDRSFSISFTSEDVYTTEDELLQGIKDKLAALDVSTDNGTVKADTLVKVESGADGKIEFSDKASTNTVTISASGNFKTAMGINGSDSSSFTVNEQNLYTTSKVGDALSGAEMKFTLDGVTKTITLPTYTDGMTGDAFVQGLQTALDNAFGKDKITVNNNGTGTNLQLSITTQEGSSLAISSDVGKTLGLQSNNETTYTNTGKTLGDLLGDKLTNDMALEAVGEPANFTQNDDGTYTDEAGNTVIKDTDGQYYRVNEDGKKLYEFKLNGVTIGNYTKDTALESVMVDINNNTEAGVKVSFSQTTNQFLFSAQETGVAGKIEMGDGLAEALFGDSSGYTKGTDAQLTAKVNGQEITMTRSSNSFSIDGLTVNLKGTFGYVDGQLDPNAEAVTFTSETDADTIVDAVKNMVEDYNEMVNAIRDAYNTMPAQKTDGSRYKPLTAEDKEGMTESEIEAYEEKAKQGLLFMDRDLSALYSALTNAISPMGSDGSLLRSIGINTKYSNGITTLSLDEDALREALASNPDNVRNAFTKTAGNGASTDGLMESLRKVVYQYGNTLGTKGILVNRAGSIKSPSTLNSNTIQEQLDAIDEQIAKWQEKLSDQIDYYTSKFTQLEQLVAQMNSQSSALAGLMGGY